MGLGGGDVGAHGSDNDGGSTGSGDDGGSGGSDAHYGGTTHGQTNVGTAGGISGGTGYSYNPKNDPIKNKFGVGPGSPVKGFNSGALAKTTTKGALTGATVAGLPGLAAGAAIGYYGEKSKQMSDAGLSMFGNMGTSTRGTPGSPGHGGDSEGRFDSLLGRSDFNLFESGFSKVQASKDLVEKTEAEKRKKGPVSTLLTSGAGITTPAPVYHKTLLGG